MRVYLGLGSNLGDREKYLSLAKDRLNSHSEIDIIKESEILETKPYGRHDQPDFLNQVVLIETGLSAEVLLELCLSIEAGSGRKRDIKWGPRTLDIDILFYEDKVFDTDTLQIPHPDLYNREFVLKSLVELDPEFVHPVLKENIQKLYNKLLSR